MVEGQYYTDQEKVYHDGLTSIAQSGRRVVYSGCLVEAQAVPEMTVLVNEGIVYFGTQIVGVNSSTNLVIPAAHATYNRYDIVVVNSTGTVSLLSGTPKSESDGYGPVPPAFDADTYLVLARITVENSTSTISSTDIKDLRALGYNTGSGGGIGSYNISFTSETSKVVTHNLNDPIPVVECWDDDGAYFVPTAITKIDDDSTYVEFGTTATGRITVHGGIYNQLNATQARDEVTITDATCNTYTHSFAVKPIVQFVDSDGVIQNSGYTVDHLSNNTVYTEFSPQTSGTLILCGGALNIPTENVHVEIVRPDTTYPVLDGYVGRCPVADFSTNTTSACSFSFRPMSGNYDMGIVMQYCMSTSDTGTGFFRLDSDSLEDAEVVPTDPTTSKTEIITLPTVYNEVDFHESTSLIIPSSMLVADDVVCCKLTREGLDADDTHAGDFRLMNIEVYYITGA